MFTVPRASTRSPASSWSLRLITLALWALVGSSAVYWLLRLSPQPSASAPTVTAPALPVPDATALAWLLGSASAVPEPLVQPQAPSRMVLWGVLAGRKSGTGAALLAIDGKPAKPYRVGAQVEPGLILQSVGPREARLGATRNAAPTMTLTLPTKK